MTDPDAALFFSERDGVVECELCPRRCVMKNGQSGLCRVRYNRNGKPELPYYGLITALAVDPIEKKPLYHFRPGTEILSAGFTGCNLKCPFCQNWHISQDTGSGGRPCSPGELISSARKSSCSIAYTYSEPLVHIEFILDCMKEARKAGIANVLVTNGCVNEEAAEEVLNHTDAANIDLKCFSEKTYSKFLGGDLKTVLAFIKRACEKDVHIELTTLVVPGLNDSEEELDACIDFIAGLKNGEDSSGVKPAVPRLVPWHLSAYHPSWKWNAPPTPPALLNETAIRARKRLAYVYTGNIAGEKNDTSCPRCGKTLISRRGFRADTTGLDLKEEDGKSVYYCKSCGKKAPVK